MDPHVRTQKLCKNQLMAQVKSEVNETKCDQAKQRKHKTD
jgi:hypothetical protein